MVSPGSTGSVASILLMLSVTLSSPLLALNLLFRSPIPIPTELFETYSEPPSAVLRAPSPQSTAAGSYKCSHEYKRSGSVTVVESRRSTDVWLTNGDAVDGKGRIGRAIGLLGPKPRLAVLPPEGDVGVEVEHCALHAQVSLVGHGFDVVLAMLHEATVGQGTTMPQKPNREPDDSTMTVLA